MKHKSNLPIIFGIITFIIVVVIVVNWDKINNWMEEQGTVTTEQVYQEPQIITIPEKESWKDDLRENQDFKQQIEDELEKRYWLEMDQRSGEELLKLQEKGFSGQRVSAVRHFLKEQDSGLALYADKIVGQPRWVEALALVGKETSFCERGVGSSKNNCGAIKGGTGFRVYATQFDGFMAVVELLQKDLYVNSSIAQMNGTYCVHEESSNGVGECPNWTEVIEDFISDIHLAMI